MEQQNLESGDAQNLALTNQESQIGPVPNVAMAELGANQQEVLPLQGQGTFLPARQNQPSVASRSIGQQEVAIDDELHLAQNPTVEEMADQSLPILQPTMQRSRTQGLTRTSTSGVLGRRTRRHPVANENLLDSDSSGSDNALQPGAQAVQQSQPLLRRSATNNSGQIESSQSTISFRNAPQSTSNAIANQNTISPTQQQQQQQPYNPFTGSSGRRSNASASFFSAIGQRAREGAFQPMQPLESRFLLNPFARQTTQSSAAEAGHEGAQPQLAAAAQQTQPRAEESKQGSGSAAMAPGGEAEAPSEHENFERMLADNSRSSQAAARGSTSPAMPVAPSMLQPGSSAILRGSAQLGAQQAATGNTDAPTFEATGLHRSRSMYETFARARPVGLLSGITNQRLPEPTLRRNHSFRSASHQQEQEADVISTSSLSLHRQENETNSLSPSPSARMRYMNVPLLPGARSRVSNSDRHSQASGTPVEAARQRINVRGNRPVSPLINFRQSMLAQEMPNLHGRMRQQPATPNPGRNQQLMRLFPIVQEAEENNDARSQRSQRSASNRDAHNQHQFGQSASRRSLLEPLRAGEEIASPVNSNPNVITQAVHSRPPVPVEPLAPVPEEPPQPVVQQQSIINPVPHVELQQTARFPQNRQRVPQRSSVLQRSLSSFNIRLHPADSPSASQLRQPGRPQNLASMLSSRVLQRRQGVVMDPSDVAQLQNRQLVRSQTTRPQQRRGATSTLERYANGRILEVPTSAVAPFESDEGGAGAGAGGDDSPASQRALAADVRILRSLTGANMSVGPPQLHEDSGTNSYKSEEDELESSRREEAEQDSILDSVSGDEDSNTQSFEVESDWSELECIFMDMDEYCTEIQQQNEQNSGDRQVNVDELLEKMRSQRDLARELIKQFGTIAAVALFRSTKHGSSFDFKMFQELGTRLGRPNRSPFAPLIRLKIQHFVHRLCEIVQDCFTTLQSKEGSPSPQKTSNLEAYKFLTMLSRVIPHDHQKLRRITLTKTIPNLTRLTKDLIDLTKEMEGSRTREEGTSGFSERVGKIKAIEKKAQLYMRELFMAKMITDFHIQIHLAMGTTSSGRAGELALDLLPFAIQIHELLPSSLTRVLNLMIRQNSPITTRLQHDRDKQVVLCGFIVAHPTKELIVSYYSKILAQQLQLHQETLLLTNAKKQPKAKGQSRSSRSLTESKIKNKRSLKRLRKQQKLYTML